VVGGSERLGLARNPFRSDAGDPLAIHVGLESDRILWAAQGEALAGRTRPCVAILGADGLGRSHRLAVAAGQARAAGAFHATHRAAGIRPDALTPRLAHALMAASPLGPRDNALSAPRWYRTLVPLSRRNVSWSQAADDGASLAAALNANAPAFLLLDDLHRLPVTRATDRHMATLESVRDHLAPGVLMAWTSDPRHGEVLQARFAGLVGRSVELRPLTDREAADLVAVRLESARMAAGVDPLYPFTPEAVERLNRAAEGNPRRLLRLAELLLESTAAAGAFEVDLPRVEAFLQRPVPSRLQAGQ
jgi:hypothetical protein